MAGSNRDKVALATPLVSIDNLQLLALDGWRVAVVPFIENPFIEEENVQHLSYEERHERGRRKTVLSKLHIWNLVRYDTVLYLDTDTLVVPGWAKQAEKCWSIIDIDQLFDCGKKRSVNSKLGQFCALQHQYLWNPTSEWLFNAGVLVIKPSRDVFRDILMHSRSVGTNTNFGDQGMLNKYFYYLCASGGQVLFKDANPQQKASIECNFPDLHFINTAPSDRLERFRDYCKLFGYEVANEKSTLLPPIFEPISIKIESKLYLLGNETSNNKTDDDTKTRSKFDKTHMWRPVTLPKSITKVYEADLSGCQQLNGMWHTWVREDIRARRQCRTGVIHFLNANRKPWSWRFWPLGGYYQMWHNTADLLPFPWTDTLSQGSSWLAFPIVFSTIWLVYLSVLGRTFHHREETSKMSPRSMGMHLADHQVSKLNCFDRLLPTLFDRSLYKWERLSILLLASFSISGCFLSYELNPSRLSPIVGWTVYFEWSLFYCMLGVSLWALVVYFFASSPADQSNTKLSQFESLPSGPQVNALIQNCIYLAAVHVLLDLLGFSMFVILGRSLNYFSDWKILLSTLPYMMGFRVFCSFYFGKEGLVFLQKLIIHKTNDREY
eukprot:TRINITY_DN3765_c0_g1_i1.p1 TRINITY_DN3765_c0_g1~~TRINITY_DN3765_c0_g1_i1.p1  ORF type:complete len:664 (-),score=84.83 TRINITY_DN3765_c0_g1_i1:170-1990(-)